MNAKWKLLAPALCTAAGIMIATLVAVFTQDLSTPLQMSGPLLYATSMLGGDMLAGRAQGRARLLSGSAIVLALSFLVASCLIALRNPDLLPIMIAVLGGSVSTPLLSLGATQTCKAKAACR